MDKKREEQEKNKNKKKISTYAARCIAWELIPFEQMRVKPDKVKPKWLAQLGGRLYSDRHCENKTFQRMLFRQTLFGQSQSGQNVRQ